MGAARRSAGRTKDSEGGDGVRSRHHGPKLKGLLGSARIDAGDPPERGGAEEREPQHKRRDDRARHLPPPVTTEVARQTRDAMVRKDALVGWGGKRNRECKHSAEVGEKVLVVQRISGLRAAVRRASNSLLTRRRNFVRGHRCTHRSGLLRGGCLKENGWHEVQEKDCVELRIQLFVAFPACH